MATSGIPSNNNASTSGTTSLASSAQGGATTGTEFLKLLVTQLQNQDPLNPMDNAQMTTQLAQLNTVDQLTKLNTSFGAMGTQMLQMQTLQGAALVGRDVAVQGDQLRVREGVGDGGFELQSKSDRVMVEIVDANGDVIDTLTLGALEPGRHSFEWTVPEAYADKALTFDVKAFSGTNTVETLELQHDTIDAVSTFGDTLALEISTGQRVLYDAVWAFL